MVTAGAGTFEVRRLEPDDDRSGFRSGNVELDRFFLRYAGQNQFRHHIGTTYIAGVKPEAVAFYEKLGFLTLEAVAGQLGDRPVPLPMFLEIAQVS